MTAQRIVSAVKSPRAALDADDAARRVRGLTADAGHKDCEQRLSENGGLRIYDPLHHSFDERLRQPPVAMRKPRPCSKL
jgi:hypothetical protein